MRSSNPESQYSLCTIRKVFVLQKKQMTHMCLKLLNARALKRNYQEYVDHFKSYKQRKHILFYDLPNLVLFFKVARHRF